MMKRYGNLKLLVGLELKATLEMKREWRNKERKKRKKKGNWLKCSGNPKRLGRMLLVPLDREPNA
jgi:hypothetical protein